MPQNATTQHAREWPAWADKFLEVLSTHGVVSRAAKASGVDRRTVYRLREADTQFAAAWKEAERAGGLSLVEEAYRRAVEGVDRVIRFDKDGEPITQKEYSDNLLLALLKARFPDEFKERVENRNINLTPEDLEKLSDDDLKRLVEGK